MTTRPPAPTSAWDQPPASHIGIAASIDPATAARILLSATAVGLLAQLLFVGQSIGVNVGLATVAVLVAARLVRPSGTRTDRADWWLVPAALVFAALPAMRAAPALVGWDGAAALALTGFAVAGTLGVRVTRRTASAIATLAAVGLVAASIGAARLAPGLAPRRGRLATTRASGAGPVVRGMLLALPVIAVFVLLFASADAVFQRVLADTFRLDLDVTGSAARLAVALTIAWAVAGWFAFAAQPDQLERRLGPVPPGLAGGGRRARIGPVEATVVILATDILFAAFVVIQAAYLFGGRDTLALTGLSYSEYARRGFFELLGAAGMAGVVIVALDALSTRRSRVFSAGAVSLAVLAGGVLVSAATRLGLYQAAYGWTELRMYAIAGLVWVGASLLATVVLLGAGRTRWLTQAMAGAALVVALGVNLVDPQAFVAARNVERARHSETIVAGGRSGLDAAYLATLGDDAVPTLVAALPTLPPSDALQVRGALLERRRELAATAVSEGWPSFNLARARARDALAGADLGAAPAR